MDTCERRIAAIMSLLKDDQEFVFRYKVRYFEKTENNIKQISIKALLCGGAGTCKHFPLHAVRVYLKSWLVTVLWDRQNAITDIVTHQMCFSEFDLF